MREIMISSTVMILLVMLFRVIFRGKVRHCLIYAMWLFVALRLLVPVNIGTFSFGVSGMMNQVHHLCVQESHMPCHKVRKVLRPKVKTFCSQPPV